MSNNSIIQEGEVHSCDNLKQFSEHVAVIADLVNPSDVIRMLRWLHRPGDTFEIRTLKSQTDKYAGTSSGYFRDFDTAVEAVAEHVGHYRPCQVYVTLNPTLESLYARVAGRIEAKQKATTKDDDIIRIRNILIDCDPVRPANIPSSSSELEAARKSMEVIRAWLCERGWPVPLVGMSGNGYHLIYAVDLNVDEDSHRLVEDLIEVLAAQFDNDVVHLDRSVHNPGRVCKLYGTFPIKGDGADDRVNRMSYIVEHPDRVEVTAEMILAVIDENKSDKLPATVTGDNASHTFTGKGVVNITRFLDHRGIGHRHSGNGKFILDKCVFNPDHNHGEVAVFQNTNGSLGYHCFHNSCAGKCWQDFVQVVGRVTKNDFDGSFTADSPTTITQHFEPDHPDVPPEPVSRNFPVEALPEHLRQYVIEVSSKTNSSPAIAATTALGVLAAAIQNVAIVKKTGWDLQNLSLFILIILESAGGKTRGMAPVTRAYRELQAEKERQVEAKRQQNREVAKALQRECDQLTRGKSKQCSVLQQINQNEQAGLVQQLQEYQQKIDDLCNPTGGSCLVYDTTIEACLMRMVRTDERVASLGGESRFIDMALGLLYHTQGSPQLAVNAFDGEEIINHRVGKGSIVLSHPALTIVNGIQPEKFKRDYLNRLDFADSGFLQRFLLISPEPIYAVSQNVDIDAGLQKCWDQQIIDLSEMKVSHSKDECGDDTAEVQPHVITISTEGEAKIRELEGRTAQNQAEVRKTHTPRWGQWLGRVVSQTIRIAGLLHAYRYGPDFVNQDIDGQDVGRASKLMAYYYSEAERIINGVTHNETTENTKIVKDYISSKQLSTFKTKVIRDGLIRRISDDTKMTKTQKIKAALNELEEEGFLHKDPSGRGETWIVNTELHQC